MDRPAQPAVLRAMSAPGRSGPSPMAIALEEAAAAAGQGEVPVGAVIIDGATGAVIARAGNRMRALNDPTAHAEMLVIRAATARLQTARLEACDLFVTLEPCTMCAAAIAFARVRRLVFGAYDPKGGGVEHGARFFAQPTCHYRPEVIGGVEEQHCRALLQAFFRARRPQV